MNNHGATSKSRSVFVFVFVAVEVRRAVARPSRANASSRRPLSDESSRREQTCAEALPRAVVCFFAAFSPRRDAVVPFTTSRQLFGSLDRNVRRKSDRGRLVVVGVSDNRTTVCLDERLHRFGGARTQGDGDCTMHPAALEERERKESWGKAFAPRTRFQSDRSAGAKVTPLAFRWPTANQIYF